MGVGDAWGPIQEAQLPWTAREAVVPDGEIIKCKSSASGFGGQRLQKTIRFDFFPLNNSRLQTEIKQECCIWLHVGG